MTTPGTPNEISTARQTAVRIGRVGVWSSALANATSDQVRNGIAQVEELGYGAVWVGETPRVAREVFAHAGLLLAVSQRIVIGTGIANIWLRPAATMAAAAGTLSEAYPDRFILGLGASHAVAVARVGQDYSKPYSAMRAYLEEMTDLSYQGPASSRHVPVVLAALRSRMQALARDATDGAHTFFVTPEHTAAARGLLGPNPLLVPEQAVVLDPDPDTARARARAHVRSRLRLPAYVAHLLAMGFTSEDLAGDGSDNLVDQLVAWGHPAYLARRVNEHLDAGADHVAVHPLPADGDPLGLRTLVELATELGLS